MISFFKKKKPKKDENDLTPYVASLLLLKSTLLIQYSNSDEKRKHIIHTKYILSKCSSIVYNFSKYCTNNMYDVNIDAEWEPLYGGSLDWITHYTVIDGNRGFDFSKANKEISIRIKTKNGWRSFSKSNFDYIILADLYCALKNAKTIDERIKEQRKLEESINEYKEQYGG